MKNRGVCWAALILAGFFGGLSARADCVTEFFRSIPEDTVRRNCWPVPFVYPARQAAREPFATMVANGWERQNMLTDEHFDSLTGRLTPAGEAKVQTVLNNVPQHHRYVFVHRARTRQETATRIDAVEQFIVRSVPPAEYPPVLESARSTDGYSAERSDAVERKFHQSVPDPKLLPKDSGSTSSGSGGH